MKKAIAVLSLSSLTVVLMAGCASAPLSESLAEEPAVVEQVEKVATLELPDGSTAEGVVLAAFLLNSGDISRAIEEGLVTPEEVDLALAAIEDNTLQDWVSLAEE